MIHTVGTIIERVDDPASILTAANATGSITSNSDQMPTSNQETGSKVIELLGERAKNFTDVESTVVVDLAYTMLGASANMFDAACKTVPVTAENNTDISLLVNLIIN